MPTVRLVLLAPLALTAACEQDRAEPARTTVTSAVIDTDARARTERAVLRIARARCAAEDLCHQDALPSNREQSLATCTDLHREELRRDLSPERCPRGVEGNRVADCVAAMEEESCLDPVDALSRLEACRPKTLCVPADAP